jgi:copper chaperone CopZ
MLYMRVGGKLFCVPALSLASLAFVGCSSSPTQSPPAAQSVHGTSNIDDQPIKASIATLVVHGMSCPQCSTNVDKQLLAVPGVQKVQINLGTGEVDVRLSGQQPPTGNQLAAAIKKSGYTLVRIETGMEPVPHGNGKTATVEK